MAINLIDLISREFTGDSLSRVASAVNEPEQKVREAAGGIAPALVAALAGKAATGQGLSQILDLMKSSGFDGSAPLGLSSATTGSTFTEFATRGAPMVASLFGGRQSAITDWLASLAGIGSRSSSTLLAMAAPAVLNLLGSQARKGGTLTSSALGDFLGEQVGFLRNAAPPGLASALGLTDLSKLGLPAAPAVHHAVPAVKASTSWWPWAALAALALLGLWWFANRAPADTVDPRVAISNDDGRIVCSATLRDAATRDRMMQALHASFGQATACDITVDPNVKAIAWLPNVDKIIAALKRPGTDFRLGGSSITLGGRLSAADRTAMLGDLKGLLGPDYAFAQAADR